ncbi:MAG: ankyrin repeat domain-containing protein, partial [Akkermansiaceae bacterium]
GEKKDRARQELETSGYQATPEDFLRAVENGDTRALALYVKNKMDLSVKDANGWGAMHLAARSGRQESIAFLLEHKQDVDTPGLDNITPLMLAAREGQAAMVRYLLKQGAKAELKDDKSRTALILAVDGQHNACIEELAGYSRGQLDTALLYASAQGKHGTIDTLTAYGASVYARHDGGMTPLMLAAHRGDELTTQALLDAGSNRFAMNEHGWTASQVAAAAGHEDLANLLGSEPSASDTQLAETSNETEWNEPTLKDPAAPLPTVTDAPAPNDHANLPTAPKNTGKITRKKIRIPSISQQPLPTQAKQPTALAKEITMRDYRESPLPIMLEKTSRPANGKPTAQVRMLYGKQEKVQVSEGDTIPNTRFRITRIKRMLNHSKITDGKPTDVSTVEIEDARTGKHRTMTARIPAAAAEPWAVLHHRSSGKNFAVRSGETFKTASGESYIVTDVRPTQLVLTQVSSGETITVPMGR